MNQQWSWGVAAVVVIGIQGCQCFHKCCPPANSCASYGPAPVAAYLPPHPLTPAAAAPPAPAPVDVRNYAGTQEPPADTTWHAPANGNVRLTVPEAGAPAAPESPRLYPPEPINPTPATAEPPKAAVTEEPAQAAPSQPKPAVTETPGRTPPLPVGIPQFAAVNDNVATGLKPLIDGGLDWLQANHYRTALHLLAPGEDDSADRKQIEKYGMRYLSLEVAPQDLAKAADQFNRIVATSANYPLFVYDKDGMRAGALWYLNFVVVDRVPEETARSKAGRLGLKDSPDADRTLWLAIQKYLSDLKTAK
jgi:hypothetical protein